MGLGFLLMLAGGLLVNAGITDRGVFDLVQAGIKGTAAARRTSSASSAAVAPTVAGAGPAQAAGTTPAGQQLVAVVGQPAFKLQTAAATALQRAEVLAGTKILLKSAYRSHAEQVVLYAADPDSGQVAKPGSSYHEQGLAIDIVNQADPRIASALAQTGWHQWSATREPWHWSYGVTG